MSQEQRFEELARHLAQNLADMHQWAKAYDWYYQPGDEEGELSILRGRIETLLETAATMGITTDA